MGAAHAIGSGRSWNRCVLGRLPSGSNVATHGTPPIGQEQRRRIDEQAVPEERANLLAVSQMLVQLRYNDPKLVAILGRRRAMIESPLINEIVAENTNDPATQVPAASIRPTLTRALASITKLHRN